jgi:hypothetical protein
VQAKEALLKRYPPLAKYGPAIGVADTFLSYDGFYKNQAGGVCFVHLY